MSADPGIEDISTVNGVIEALNKLEEREKEVSNLLDGYISRQYYLEAKLKGITKVIPDLQTVHSDADRLAEMIKHTAHLAETVSEKVRRLDTTRSRVSECQQRVHDLLYLQSCSVEAQTALQEDNFETAAAHVKRFLSMDQNILKQTADDIDEDCSNVDTSFSLLKSITETLQAEVSRNFDKAVRENDLASVERFFKIYPSLNLHNEGLQKYSFYLSSKLQETSNKNLESAIKANQMNKRPNIIFADTLTLLLEGTARVIETHHPLVQKYYAPGKLLILISFLQKECDRQSNRILSEFRNARKLERKYQQINEYERRNKNVDRLDPKNLDILLGELTLMHARVDLYFRFVKRRVLNDIEGGSVDTREKEKILKNCEELIENSELNKNMQVILDQYLLLERYFMEESIHKAILLNSLLEEGSTTSSMVDDVFFIVQKCVRRACTSVSINGICAVMNNACTFLETEYCDVMKKQLELGYPSGLLDFSQAYNALQSSFQQGRLHTSDTEQAKLMFITNLNNADISLEFIETLKNGLEEDISRSFSTMNDKDKAKIHDSLSGLKTVKSKVLNIKTYGMKKLNTSAVEPQIKLWVETFLNYSHELKENDVSNYENEEPFIQELITNITGLLKSFKTILTPSNYESLVNMVTSQVPQYLERVLFKTTFNRYGGLIFDKDVRSLVSYLTSITSWSVRDKFARLVQMATLLNLEKVSEISDWKNSGVVWTLSDKEVKKVLKLRSDFKEEDIKKIRI